MSSKRSRATFENHDNDTPFSLYGTPLPDLPDSHDDGSYLPLWKQEVRDDRGKKRLHGAFTGGWSAGYFNTVGSKEGWAPATFVSSRSNRHKPDPAAAGQRIQDYMDEEDIADEVATQSLHTSDHFAGLGSNAAISTAGDGLNRALRPSSQTMGHLLLCKMGWKDGQGIGPKVRRHARLDVGTSSNAPEGETYLFAPEDVPMIHFTKKLDQSGLGHIKSAALKIPSSDGDPGQTLANTQKTEVSNLHGSAKYVPSEVGLLRKKPVKARGSFGVGILNDTGSDDEDPYDIGPKIKYNRTIGDDTKLRNRKKHAGVASPANVGALKFVSKNARAVNDLQRCQDGRLPLSGFFLSNRSQNENSLLSQYAPPAIPAGWVSSRRPQEKEDAASAFNSCSDAAKASNHDPRSRAAFLGEEALPSKSIFDFISTSARQKLATASGREDLPRAGGDSFTSSNATENEAQRTLWGQAAVLDRETAEAALARSSSGPYGEDEAKKARYRRYLEYHAVSRTHSLSKPQNMSDNDFMQELNEFYNCAQIFKPMTGFMASRFTTSKKVLSHSSGADDAVATELLVKKDTKLKNPAEKAAKMGMFGPMTRSINEFHPTRLLCKRFNVKAPPSSRADHESGSSYGTGGDLVNALSKSSGIGPPLKRMAGDAGINASSSKSRSATVQSIQPVAASDPSQEGLNSETNDAIEASMASQDLLKAVFGDSDDEK